MAAVTTSTFATDIFNFKLKENQKYENSYSVNFENEATLHLVVVKNKDTKNYDVLPFYMNKKGEVKQMTTTSYEDEPEMVSSHKKGSTITLLIYQKRKLQVIDLDLDSPAVATESIEVREKPENIITKANKSIVVIPDLNTKNLGFYIVESSQKIDKKTVEVSKDYQSEVHKIFTSRPDIINTDEFVQNGSIRSTQVYYENGNFILISDEKANEELEAFVVNPENNESLTKKVFTTTTNLDKIKDGNSYLMDGKVFGMYLGKQDFGISVFDINTGTEEKKFLLSEDIAQIENAKNIQAYMKGVTKSKMKPTISVNKTKNNNYAVTVDYVDSSKYMYHNWMWMHHMLMQQQMMMQQNMARPSGFGPNPSNFEMDEFFDDEKSVSLNFTLDQNLTMLPNNNDPTQYQFVDKEKIMKSLEKNKDFKNMSAGFLENEYHYMYTDRAEETVYIHTKEILHNN